MSKNCIAKIAVAAANYSIDKPYDYLVPDSMTDLICPGMRVSVPFSRGNRRSEGIVLGLTDSSEYERLKPIESCLDREPMLSEQQLKLALWMHDRLFCTVYDAVRTILPAGCWFKANGVRQVNDKIREMISLSIDADEAFSIAQSKRRKAPMQASVLELLCSTGKVSAREAMHFTGASKQSVNALVNLGLVTVEYEEVFRRPKIWTGKLKSLPVLNADQQSAYSGLKELLEMPTPEAALLYGVTGSGKTSIYIRLIADTIKSGKCAILLVPEIALTPQMIQTFSEYFGNNVAILHSSLAMGERYDEWKRINNGEAKLAIGTRSAVFAPFDNLGLIIIDEEHEDSYKSENSPRYHARDIAKYRCAKSNSLLLLGSATPDIESRYAAEIGRYKLFELRGRYNSMQLPDVEIVDMKQELKNENGSELSARLKTELESNISRGEQSILFINRRGANKLICCSDCGHVYKCPNCSVSLTYHSINKRLVCHYCGYSRHVDPNCPDCGGELTFIGAGTQLIEEELKQLYPNTPVLRMDTDTVKAAGSHDALLSKFRDEKIPIMVGTQMVTKGLNFENVTLIGVISADQSLYCGDYHAGERTFSLITQVIGRSGRGQKPGRAIIQTFTPENEIIRLAAAQDYDGFYATELNLRRIQNTPPFADVISIIASGTDEKAVIKCCRDICTVIKSSLANNSKARVLGPAPLAVVKVNNRYRYRINLSCTADRYMRQLVSSVLIRCAKSGKYKGVSVFADINPSD
jgi:primosomal protein N' (replication factor Y) (superfamily II helicase)